VEIDGSLFEGGGQMIRSSLALATIINKGFRMHLIRKNRPKPGNNNNKSIYTQILNNQLGLKLTQLQVVH
jgi:RNA 3'-terminal phosphate cyclase (ATP)